MIFKTKTLLILLFILIVSNVKAQEQRVIQRISGDINFDGIIDEAAWDKIETLPLIMYNPVFGKDPSEKSEIRIAYNDDYVYVSGKMYDKNAEKIQATSMKRDEKSTANDRFTIIFDSFNDKENALAFSTTPTGLRYDYSIYNDGILIDSSEPINTSWNTFWDVETTKNDDGWFFEMRIPMSSLRFKDIDGKVVMGLICIREIPHNNEVDVYPSIPPNWGTTSYKRPSKGQEIELSGVKSKKPFYITPYIIGGQNRTNSLNETGTAYELDSDFKKDFGFDIKYGLTNNLTLDLTYNTDFAQVESDDQKVNMTRFSLNYEEKRTFFQERSSIFSFDFEDDNSMFYSRRIGLSDDGESIPIYGGARVTGMAGKWDIGFLNMQTKSYQSETNALNSLNSENFGVLRLRRNVLNENSYIGGIVTSRIDSEGNYNETYGADAIIKVFGNDYLKVKLAQTMADSKANEVFSLDATQLYFNWQRVNTIGWGYSATYSYSGKDFNPGIGFKAREDYTYYRGSLSYGWLGREESKVYSQSLQVVSERYDLHQTMDTQTWISRLAYSLSFKSGYGATFYAGRYFENVDSQFNFSADAIVPEGEYNFNLFILKTNTPLSKPFYLNTTFSKGSMYDGDIFGVTVAPQWNINSSVQVGGSIRREQIDFTSRDQKFVAVLAKLNAQVMFSTKLTFSSYVQYSKSSNQVVSNLRLRYNPREGNDLYVVFNDIRNTDIAGTDPALPRLNSQMLMLKYTYTFKL